MGLYLRRRNLDLTMVEIAMVSVPVSTRDAQRTEALGPPLAMLLLSTLSAAPIFIEGDSMYVSGLLD